MHNIYCEQNNYSDDRVYDNDESFIEEMYGENVIQLWRDLSDNSGYSGNHSYVCYNGLGNLASFDCLTDSCVDHGVSVYAKYFEENAHEIKNIKGFEDVYFWSEGSILLEVGDKVYWNDPEELSSGEYEVVEEVSIDGEDDEDTVILISNGVSQVKATANELIFK